MTNFSSRPGGRLAACGALALAAVAIAPSTALARARQKAVCNLRQDGPTSITETSARFGSGGKRYAVTLTSSVVAGGDSTVTVAAMLGKRPVIRSTFSLTGSGTQITTDFGVGFKGMRHIELSTTDGELYTGQVDGTQISVSTMGGAVASLTLPDGTPAPTIQVKRAVKRALTKAARAVEGASCKKVSSAPAPQAILDSCNTCKLGCQFDPTESGAILCIANTFASGVACAAAVAITPVFCIVSFELNGLSCTTNYTNCEKKCLTSDDCCHVFCPGAVGQCCNGDGEVCCGRDKPNGGSCCTNCCGSPAESASAVCCGRRTPDSEERLCINPAIGLCCEPSGTICGGDECCEPGATCCDNSYCTLPGGACCSTPTSPQKSFSCNAGYQCADPQSNLCCPAGVAACNGVCCTGNQICAAGNNTCCDPGDLCGDTCCPSHNCLNGNECCPTPAQCGGHCAGFGECCNGQPCAGVCVPPGGPTCCAADRVCPPDQCCPLNATCQNGSCVPCGCPSGQECCPGGTDACCTPPEICCEPQGRAKGCYAVNDCLGIR